MHWKLQDAEKGTWNKATQFEQYNNIVPEWKLKKELKYKAVMINKIMQIINHMQGITQIQWNLFFNNSRKWMANFVLDDTPQVDYLSK